MRFRSIASSSHGNAYIVEDGKTTLLIECGISKRRLIKESGVELGDISAVLISHEHADHSKIFVELIARGMDVYMSRGTAEILECEELVHEVEDACQFNVGTFDIVPFTTFHDAREPLGFLIKSRADGDILAFATDTVNLRYKFPGLNLLAIEANYDKDVLERSEKLPEKVKKRITRTHMEIGTLCDYLSTLDLKDCKEIYLMHLSDGMSREDEFIKRVKGVVPAHVNVSACRR